MAKTACLSRESSHYRGTDLAGSQRSRAFASSLACGHAPPQLEGVRHQVDRLGDGRRGEHGNVACPVAVALRRLEVGPGDSVERVLDLDSRLLPDWQEIGY
jgi:hypothetical protein